MNRHLKNGTIKIKMEKSLLKYVDCHGGGQTDIRSTDE